MPGALQQGNNERDAGDPKEVPTFFLGATSFLAAQQQPRR